MIGVDSLLKGKKIPHIAVVGAGAMGSIYACMFAEAGCSTSVVDIWREHIDRIREFGLRIEGKESDNKIFLQQLKSLNLMLLIFM